jgi:hypothetical protein
MIMPFLRIASEKGVPSAHLWNSVSSKSRKPEMYFDSSGVASSSSRYARRFSSVFSTAAGKGREGKLY